MQYICVRVNWSSADLSLDQLQDVLAQTTQEERDISDWLDLYCFGFRWGTSLKNNYTMHHVSRDIFLLVDFKGHGDVHFLKKEICFTLLENCSSLSLHFELVGQQEKILTI